MKYLFALLMASTSAFAGQHRGGGDDLALRFVAALGRALDWIHAHDPALQSRIQGLDLLTVATQAHIVVSDEPLSLIDGGLVMHPMIINDPDELSLTVDRDRYERIVNAHIEEGMALHETLSLLKIESTGHYPVSGLYLARFGLSLSVLAPLIEAERPDKQEFLSAKIKCLARLDAMLKTTGEVYARSIESEGSYLSWADGDKSFNLQALDRDSSPEREVFSITAVKPMQTGEKTRMRLQQSSDVIRLKKNKLTLSSYGHGQLLKQVNDTWKVVQEESEGMWIDVEDAQDQITHLPGGVINQIRSFKPRDLDATSNIKIVNQMHSCVYTPNEKLLNAGRSQKVLAKVSQLPEMKEFIALHTKTMAIKREYQKCERTGDNCAEIRGSYLESDQRRDALWERARIKLRELVLKKGLAI